MEDFQSIPQKKFRKRRVFSIGIIVVGTIEWTGKWFKYVDIEEQLYHNRSRKFDEWNYTFYWGEWYSSWEFVRLL